MLSRRLIPCLDVRDGRVVKGIQFKALRDAGDPRELAAVYEEQGADELVMLDISATKEGRAACLETVALIRNELSIPLSVGGGVRAAADVEALLERGADKVASNSAAVRKPDLLDEFARRFGSQCTVLALDASRQDNGERWEVVIDSGSNATGLDAAEWAAEAESRGAGEILLTSHDRDGTGQGYDLDLIRAISSRVRIPIIASGGARSAEHLEQAFAAGADAVLAASILHYGETTLPALKAELAEAGIEVRR
ncbi:MAG: imidazole glycerol phosphate synthase subunit HisF [Planctomycetota bacterium]|jgi:imidazoleglycerol phosphate synthase cyclase subunit